MNLYMKNIWVLSLIAVCISCQERAEQNGNSSERIPYNVNWIPFQWYADSLGGKYYDKLVMQVPISIQDSNGFVAQFDLGSNTNMIYEKSLLNAFEDVSAFELDSVDTDENYYWMRNADILLGDEKSRLQDWVVLTDFGGGELMGTIGVAEFANQSLIIDYPNERIAVLDSIPKAMEAEFEFLAGEMVDNKMILELNSGEESHRVNFDTGSSITPLFLSDSVLFDQITDPILGVDTLRGFKSWGRPIDVIPGAISKEELRVGDYNFGHQMIYYANSAYHRDLYAQEEIVALAGSVLFFEKEILIDYNRGRMGVRKAAN